MNNNVKMQLPSGEKNENQLPSGKKTRSKSIKIMSVLKKLWKSQKVSRFFVKLLNEHVICIFN